MYICVNHYSNILYVIPAIGYNQKYFEKILMRDIII